MTEKILLGWSGGKDSSMALYELKRLGKYDITLLTTVTEQYNRISMHGVRTALLERQAESLGCGLEKVYISPECSNEEYENKMEAMMNRYKGIGVRKVAFGDLFLEDIREYRETNLKKSGMEAIFPLWGRDTGKLANTFIDLGFKAIITCVDTKVLNGDFAGRYYDRGLLTDLPANVDPCGENGEFHSFVFDGPIFNKKIDFTVGERTLRDERFSFCDLIQPIDY
ncbi:MAG TPA: diphthine--ammonia ligase [Clostridia bacterium]|nr:diphthine--ammonia ligase [Clostridia bacterium]